MSETNYFGLMIITASTVAKIMLCSIAGMVVSKYFSAREHSEKGLSYISVQVFLPCLLFSNLCLNVTMEDVKRYYWAPILACIPVILGLTGATLLSPLNAQKYRGLLLLGSSFQNGLTFPLSVIVNLKGISWFGDAEAAEAQRYIFLYNIICSIGLWAIGDPLIAHYKARDVEKEKAQEASHALAVRQAEEGDGATNRSFAYPYTLPQAEEEDENETNHGKSGGHGSASSQSRKVVREEDVMVPESPRKRTATAHEQLHWYQPPGDNDVPIASPVRGETGAQPSGGARKSHGKHVQDEDETVNMQELNEELQFPDGALMLPPGLVAGVGGGGSGEGRHRDGQPDAQLSRDEPQKRPSRNYGALILRAVQSRPVFVSLLALLISLVPPLAWCARSFPGQMLLGGFSIVGTGAIPLQLLVLGCNVVSSRPKAAEPVPESVATVTATTGGGATATAVQETNENGEVVERPVDDESRNKCGSLMTFESLFMVCSIGVRMFVIPCVSFLLIHLMRVSGLLPNERPFLLAMLVAVNSPSAINSALICSMHDYHARVYSQMIFFMYITSIFTATIGLFFFILYLN